MLGGLSFRSLERAQLDPRAAYHDPVDVGEVTITLRTTQKNGSNSEKRVRDEHNTKLCDVRLTIEILARFSVLVSVGIISANRSSRCHPSCQ